MFMFLLQEHKKIRSSRKQMLKEYKILYFGVNKLKRVWMGVVKVGMIYKKYNLTPEDMKEVRQLYTLAAEVMEGEYYENGTEPICNGGRNKSQA